MFRRIVALSGIAGIIISISSVLLLAGSGKSISDSLPVVITFVVTYMPMLFAAVGIDNKVNNVQKTVNGNFSALSERNVALQKLAIGLATALPPEVAAPIIREHGVLPPDTKENGNAN